MTSKQLDVLNKHNEILKLVAAGKTRVEIAEMIGVKYKYVDGVIRAKGPRAASPA